MNFKETLRTMDACPPAMRWVKARTLRQAWRDCRRPDWLMWLVEEVECHSRTDPLTLVDAAVRELAPAALDRVGAQPWADLLRDLPRVTGEDSALQARYFIQEAREALRECAMPMNLGFPICEGLGYDAYIALGQAEGAIYSVFFENETVDIARALNSDLSMMLNYMSPLGPGIRAIGLQFVRRHYRVPDVAAAYGALTANFPDRYQGEP